MWRESSKTPFPGSDCSMSIITCYQYIIFLDISSPNEKLIQTLVQNIWKWWGHNFSLWKLESTQLFVVMKREGMQAFWKLVWWRLFNLDHYPNCGFSVSAIQWKSSPQCGLQLLLSLVCWTITSTFIVAASFTTKSSFSWLSTCWVGIVVKTSVVEEYEEEVEVLTMWLVFSSMRSLFLNEGCLSVNVAFMKTIVYYCKFQISCSFFASSSHPSDPHPELFTHSLIFRNFVHAQLSHFLCVQKHDAEIFTFFDFWVKNQVFELHI